MADYSFRRLNIEILKYILLWWAAGIVIVTAFVAALAIGQYTSRHGVLPVALIAVSSAVALTLIGSLWRRSLAIAGMALAWVATAVVFIERCLALGLSGWAAGAWWMLAAIGAFAVHSELETKLASDAVGYRSVLFYGLFILWPATALLFLERGNALHMNRLVVAGIWAGVSFVALLIYLVKTADESVSDDESAPID